MPEAPVATPPFTPKPKYCTICGELIPWPVPYWSRSLMCTDCSGDYGVPARKIRPGYQEREYHGDMFNAGEW